MQLATQPDLIERVPRIAENHGRLDRVAADPLRVSPGVHVLLFQHPDRHLDLAHELLLVALVELADGGLEPLLIALLQVTVLEDEAALLGVRRASSTRSLSGTTRSTLS
jgi:hypothetical protein